MNDRASDDPDDTLLPAVARGDRLAVQRCISRFGGLVWGIARRLSPTTADAEDAVQEVFTDLWRSASRFDPARGSERVFVALIARRRLIDRLRSMRSRLAAETAILPQHDEIAAAEPTHDEQTDAAIARVAFGTLPPEHQRIISLSLVEGWSHGEIAARTGVPLGTVKTVIRRGIFKVRVALRTVGKSKPATGNAA
ncbi:MAG TPA: sigma-70 family RNA polymerase sigma factor [Steroidobacteraceae bacterium]|nr:sigma-70 family RNA polymerase sigma factor [Steroidobacteraceae bacterium]HRX89380.1 sigma-70 family RNA polymerase sigma factor [Steroidobacteraceae bacterium]